MKTVAELISKIKTLEIKGDLEVSVGFIVIHSADVTPGTLFIAIAGEKVDGHNFITEAIGKGAKVIVYQNTVTEFKDGITYIKVSDAHAAAGYIATAFYDYPSEKLKLIGVTGTNGKTTITTLLHQLFRSLGYKAGMIGTIVHKINDKEETSVRTTPDPVTLNQLLKKMVDAGCTYCFMEVSSHSLVLGRVSGLEFTGGIFTNITHDHLDFHKSFESYKNAKKSFFDRLPADSFALTNSDDTNGEYMMHDTKAKKHTYSLKTQADFNERLESNLVGEFNAYNILAVYACAVLLGENTEKVTKLIKMLNPAPGRFESFKSASGVLGIVDYAHTPDAVENVLKAIRTITPGKIITVIGCGGDRDISKRPTMAEIAYRMSDIVILTSDNPRSEKPEDIISEMQKGIQNPSNEKLHTIVNRDEAIQKACSLVQKDDCIVLLGKGHENYQEVQGIKTHFDDMEELKKYLV